MKANTSNWAVALAAGSVLAMAGGAALADIGAKASAAVKARPANAAAAHVLSAQARPLGYSLADMARETAGFNASNHSGEEPNTPFQMLYTSPTNTFDVKRGTFLYVPVAWSDDSNPVLGDFPVDVEDRAQLLHYWYHADQVGVVETDVTVDGGKVALGSGYLSGVLLGNPIPSTGGSRYVAPAAFIAPLPPGRHTVSIHLKATGAALSKPPFDQFFPNGVFEFETTYTVNVR